MTGPNRVCHHCDSLVEGPYDQRFYRLDYDRSVFHTLCPNCNEVLRAWLEDGSDFPIDSFALVELEEISYHVKAARWHMAKATRASHIRPSCDGQRALESAYRSLSDLEEVVQESVIQKQQELNK